MSSSRSGRTSHRHARGQGLVEFALVAPLLIGLAFGIFDFGRGMSANITVTNSSREGARYLGTAASTASSPYATTCPNTSVSPATAPASTSAQSKAWNQMQGAGLDMTGIKLLTVSFYKSSNDPSTSGATPNMTVTCATNGGGQFTGGTPSPVTGSHSGDSSYVPQTGDWVQFEVRYQYTTATPIIHQLVPTVTIDQTTTMVLE